MKTPKRPTQAFANLSPGDANKVRRDRVRLLGVMADLLDREDEDEVRAVLIDLGLPVGTPEHERILRYWKGLLAENQARRRRP